MTKAQKVSIVLAVVLTELVLILAAYMAGTGIEYPDDQMAALGAATLGAIICDITAWRGYRKVTK